MCVGCCRGDARTSTKINKVKQTAKNIFSNAVISLASDVEVGGLTNQYRTASARGVEVSAVSKGLGLCGKVSSGNRDRDTRSRIICLRS